MLVINNPCSVVSNYIMWPKTGGRGVGRGVYPMILYAKRSDIHSSCILECQGGWGVLIGCLP